MITLFQESNPKGSKSDLLTVLSFGFLSALAQAVSIYIPALVLHRTPAVCNPNC